MVLFEFDDDSIRPLQTQSFAKLGVRERDDLQRLLRERFDVLVPDAMVVAEEFGDWDDSRRRIDLLGIDKQANLVVVELKRSADGGHMDLQAIRYAAMVSTMTFAQAVAAHDDYRRKTGKEGSAEEALLEFLDWDEPEAERFAQEVRIVLVAAEFSLEITTAVLWLNERDLDIRCVRMVPYESGGRRFLDVQQVLPLPEAEQFQVRARVKSSEERAARKADQLGEWNGETYVSFAGNHRDWNEAVRYGFVSAGGGPWYTASLSLLEPGRRIWVNVPRIGYVGVGEVVAPKVPVAEFIVENGKSGKVPITDLPLKIAGTPHRTGDLTEYLVRVKWLKTVPIEEAVKERGFFGNQNTAARPKSARWAFTVGRLKESFGIE